MYKGQDEDPGLYLPREEAPQLWSLTEEVAQRVGTRPVDAIYVAAGAEIAVTERGGFWKKLRGSGQRCLILGLGDLPGLPLSQFKACLLYTSDAADERSSVDLGGRRIIKKKNTRRHSVVH
mgnify:CR=1 FL=1